jgi:hypothetical protein
VKGGNFTLDPETGRCESAEKIFEHGFHSLDNRNPGLQSIINNDDELSGTFPSVLCDDAIRSRALRSNVRSCVRWMVRDALKLAEPLESDDDGTDDESGDSDSSGD